MIPMRREEGKKVKEKERVSQSKCKCVLSTTGRKQKDTSHMLRFGCGLFTGAGLVHHNPADTVGRHLELFLQANVIVINNENSENAKVHFCVFVFVGKEEKKRKKSSRLFFIISGLEVYYKMKINRR